MGSEGFSLKHVEPALRKFFTVLRMDLDRLHKHKENIGKLKKRGEVDALEKEMVNASRTVQQLKSNIKQLENTRAQVKKEDLEEFDSRIRTLQTEATVAVTTFLNLHESEEQSPLKELTSNRLGPAHPKALGFEEEEEADGVDAEGGDQQQQKQQLVVDSRFPSQESWNRLHQDLEDLNVIMHQFATIVDNQKEKVDEIEKNVETAAENVHEGTKSLAQASAWKAAAFPVVGALVGGLVGGPFGVVLGLKAGGVAAVGGGLAGFTGGTLMKKHQKKQAEMELEKLTTSRSKSHPERLSSVTGEDANPRDIVRESNSDFDLLIEDVVDSSAPGTSDSIVASDVPGSILTEKVSNPEFSTPAAQGTINT